MDTFIDKVIDEIKEKYSEDLRNLCVVFPTRRACLIFRNRFAAMQTKPVWAPGIAGIGDFVSKHATHPVSEEIPLLLSLFDIYKKHWPEQDFGRFYAWGQMLINDFDEIDKQLSVPSRVFTSITELKKIDAAFLPDPSSLSWIQEFIATMDEKNLTKLQQKFVNTWNSLQQVYDDYNALLNRKGMAYEGKAYRDIVKKLKDGTFKSPWSNFVFAGFYGFSRIEEELIQRLSAKHKVSVLWDSDSYYIENKNHEAGYYFRKSPLFKLPSSNTASHFSDTEKKIEITGVPMQAGQAKYTGDLLSRLQAEGNIDCNSTVIVLADENMLFPVLYSMPETIATINVTMGYPLQQSQYAELIKVLHELHKHTKVNSRNVRIFHHRYVQRVLNHPMFKSRISPAKIAELTEINIYSTADEIKNTFVFEKAEIVFSTIDNSNDVFNYLTSLLSWLRDEILLQSGHAVHFEDRVIDYILSELHVLYDHLSDHITEIDSETAWQMVAECISGLKVPFSGEPVQGLQIMGFLETRALDFKTVIMLNVNEGTLPATSSNKSFIPFSLRKGYGLSTFEDQDASFSYHFYRLLHTAQNIHLLYNSEVSKTNGGEPSRFLLQIKQELKRVMGDRLTINTGFVNTPIIPETILPITIKKDSEIVQALNQYHPGKDGKFTRNFSSSAVTTYIACSLRFYFRYVAGLKPDDEQETTMEAKTFGKILHRVLELLFSPVNGPVDLDVINALEKNSYKAVETAISEIYKTPLIQLEGEDILLSEVILELTKRILKADTKDIPFMVTGLEKKMHGNFVAGNLPVELYGTIDRMDESDGISRIIDYKTGRVNLKSSSMEELFTNPDKKAVFQLYFYALLFRLNYPDKPVKTGFYIARDLANGISWLNNGSVVSDESLEEFKSLLSAKLFEILNPSIDFVQTQDLKQCQYCDYKTICNR